MMAFARFNGWEVPVIGAGQDDEEIGDESVAFDGTPLKDRRAIKRIWPLKTKHSTELVAEAIRGIVLGLGDVFHFDDGFYSAKGAVASSTVGTIRPRIAADGATVLSQAGIESGKYGDGALYVEPGVTNILANDQADAENVTAGNFTAISTATLSIDTAHYLQGTKSLKVVCGNAGNVEGFETVACAASAGTAYTGSVYIYSASLVQLDAALIDDTGASTSAVGKFAYAGYWTRITVTHTTAGGATTIKLRVRETTAADNPTFWADCLQIEAGSAATSWRDPADGARAAGNVALPTSLVSGACDLTVNFWARSQSNAALQYALAIGKGTTEHLFQIRRGAGANSVVFRTAGASGAADDSITYSTSPWGASNGWAMVTAVLRRNPETGENAKTLYFNGASVGTSSPASLPVFSQIDRIHVGHLGGANWWGSTGDTSGGDNSAIDDLTFVPYAAPAELVAAWYAMALEMPLPRFYLDGDIMPDAALTTLVEGREHAADYVRAQYGSAWKTNQRRQSFKLREV